MTKALSILAGLAEVLIFVLGAAALVLAAFIVL